MTHDVLFWLLATLFWTLIMSFYSTQEMACISYNRLRLEYAVKQQKKWAIWLSYLIERPGILFSTTLIGVNVALMASSESARRLYEAFGLNPNWAPLTHIPFILLFGELVPMFAARVHAEHMCRLGVPFLYLSAKILTPVTKIIDFFFSQLNKLTKSKETGKLVFSRDELQKLIEEHEIGLTADFDAQFNEIIGNIFTLRSNEAGELMEQLSDANCLGSHATIAQVRERFIKHEAPFLLVYHRLPQKIIGAIFPQDLLDAGDHKKASEYVRAVCFVSESTHGLELLTRLHEEELSIACVLDRQGKAVGAVTLNDIFDELFTTDEEKSTDAPEKGARLTYLEKTFPAETKIADFNEAYGLHLDDQGCATFAELIESTLGRSPQVDDTISIEPIEVVVKETSLFNAKTILIRTKLT